jgi:hypothetical protein
MRPTSPTKSSRRLASATREEQPYTGSSPGQWVSQDARGISRPCKKACHSKPAGRGSQIHTTSCADREALDGLVRSLPLEAAFPRREARKTGRGRHASPRIGRLTRKRREPPVRRVPPPDIRRSLPRATDCRPPPEGASAMWAHDRERGGTVRTFGHSSTCGRSPGGAMERGPRAIRKARRTGRRRPA